MIHIDRYEKIWIGFSIAMLAGLLIAVTVMAFGYGIQLPVEFGRVDPKTVATPGVSPFGEPGLRELAPGKYDAYVLAQAWRFTPNEIRLKVGDTVTFYFTSTDVQHGVKITGTNINMMILPGQVSRLTHKFENAGEHVVICHEYCGAGHHTMFAKIIVEP
ncbi:MAG: cytochrome c oxidase subunit II [Anaerolineales bacterium]|nr:cytochrome c oxidase subunit II [Anaerolineales bacterium]MDW8327482.1 cytochrome c oxidase subunit II [Anaerolineales bacterium]